MKATVPPALAGERIDRVVSMLTGVSRAQAADLVAAGSVAVDGQAVTSRSSKVVDGAVVELPDPVADDDAPIVADPTVVVPVVYEDADLVVVDKPAGLVVHPGAGQHHGTLAHGLVARYPEIVDVGQLDRPGIVHRLDKGTSGLLLVARSQPAYDVLVAMLSAREVTRRYWTLVWGQVESPTGMVDAPIGRSSRDRTRMAVTVRGRPAITSYEVHHRFSRPVDVTELRCTLSTGRTHQIRVHLQSIGHAVVGDDRYGGGRGALPFHRPALHAEHLALHHPLTGEPLSFDSLLPEDLVGLRATLT